MLQVDLRLSLHVGLRQALGLGVKRSLVLGPGLGDWIGENGERANVKSRSQVGAET